jgi:hypothetical protein
MATGINTAAIVDRIRREAARRLLAAAITLQTAHRGDLSTGNPSPHKAPAPKGSYPRLRTGGLRANVVVSPVSISEVMARGKCGVGYRPGGMHGLYLGRKGWLDVVDTYTREKGRLAAILKGSGP